MYILLFALVFGTGALLIFQGSVRRNRVRLWSGGLLLLAGLTLLVLMAFWAEMLWYRALEFEHRFWRFVWARISVVLFGAALAGSLSLLLTRGAGVQLRRGATALAVAAGVLWGFAYWQQILLFINGVATTTADPLLGFNTGFYLSRCLCWMGCSGCWGISSARDLPMSARRGSGGSIHARTMVLSINSRVIA